MAYKEWLEHIISEYQPDATSALRHFGNKKPVTSRKT